MKKLQINIGNSTGVKYAKKEMNERNKSELKGEVMEKYISHKYHKYLRYL